MNWYYTLVVTAISFGGIPKGYDEGGFSAVVGIPSFKDAYGLLESDWEGDPDGLANRKANISSFGVLGASIGCIAALGLPDRLGRLRTWQLFIAWWASGLLIQTFASGIVGLMLFGRLWCGMGAGGATVVTPLFLSEIAPVKTRGTVVSVYMVSMLTALSIGFFINYAAESTIRNSATQYRLVIAIPLVPTGLAFIASLWFDDTPAWLTAKNRRDDAFNSLRRLRQGKNDDVAVSNEMDHLVSQIQARDHEMEGVSVLSAAKEILGSARLRKRFLLAIFMQTVAQWSGGNGVTYYVPEIFEYAGIKGSGMSLVTSGAYGVTKVVFTMIYTWGLVDVVGRRVCALSGVALQAAAHIYLAIYLSSDSLSTNKSASDAAIAAVFVYAVGWSIGLCTIQYLYATEIFPTRVRGVAYATNMVLHWFFQFAIVRVTPNMFVAWDVWGAFVFWACICVTGFIGIGICAPETNGVSMDDMDVLFSGRWYMGWRAKPPAGTAVGTGIDEGKGEIDGEEEEEKVDKV